MFGPRSYVTFLISITGFEHGNSKVKMSLCQLLCFVQLTFVLSIICQYCRQAVSKARIFKLSPT